LTLNAGKHPGNQPARLAHLDDGNDCAILVQRDEGPDQSLPRRRPGSFSWGIGALRQLFASDDGAISFAACPIASLRWRGLCPKIGLFQSSRSVFVQASISARKPIAGEPNHALSRKRRC
jgi:hypothetical protein